MSNHLQEILLFGTGDQKGYRAARIVFSNHFSLVMFALACGGLLFSLLYMPGLLFIAALAMVISPGCIFFNFLGLHDLSRFTLSVSPMLLSSLCVALLTPAGSQVVAGLLICQVVSGLTPFLIFDLREKNFLTFSGLICFAILACSGPLCNLLEVEAQLLPCRQGSVFFCHPTDGLPACCGLHV